MYRIVSILLLISSPVFAQQTPIEVASEVERVSVFLQGAQVFRVAEARVPAGKSVLKFIRLDPDLNPESIQFNAEEGLMVLGVSHSRNYLEEPFATEEASRLKALIKVKRDSVKLEQAMIEVYNQEEIMLMANQSIGGSTSGVELGRLESAANFFRQRLTEINQQVLVRNSRVATLNEEIQELQNQLQRRVAEQRSLYVSELEVTINAASSGVRDFELNYVTGRARWSPLYDLRVSDIDSPLELFYKAEIAQATGEEWENAQLVLSTADPRQATVKPNVRTRRVGFYNPRENRRRALEDRLSKIPARALSEEMAAEPAADLAMEGLPSAPPVQTRSNTTTTEFEISEPYTIESDVDPTLVDIARHELDPEYEYYAAPALSEKAFLTARLTGWESLNLLSGSSNLFFNGTFLGQTFLDMENVSDTLDLSLGTDQGIVIERKREEEFTRKQLLGNRKTDIYGFEIEVRNNKSVPVSIVIEDQIPVSSDNQIEVDLQEEGGAAVEEETGVLRWEEVIEPASTLTLNFRYSIRYPKGRTVRVY